MVSTRGSLYTNNLANDDQEAFNEDEHVEKEYHDSKEGHVEGKNQANVDDDVPGREIVMDYTNVFTTMEYFASRDALLKWARVFLACERGGEYRQLKRKSKANGKEKVKVKKGADLVSDFEESSKGRDTGTKKCGCPFSLKGTEVSPLQWILEVKCGTHNHPIATSLVGHSYAGRLSPEEEEFVINLSKCNAPPEFVLKMLKRKNANNHSTIRTIYNARKKHKLVRAFPKVLLIDCTYKTNKYRFPYFEIVGVTSTGMTFSVASVYLEVEKKDNYAWALGILRDLLGDTCLPTVIITDREEALMNAVASKFPKSRHFICTWHIERNVLVNCKGDFTCDMQWEAFNKQFTNIMFADSEKDFEDAVRVLHSDFATIMKPVKYLMTQWINPYKERFVKAWTNQVMHYGNTAMNRIESHHFALKRMLGSSLENFETCWAKIADLFEACHAAIKHSFEESVSVTQLKFASDVYNNLRGVVSIVALEKLFDEIKEVRKGVFDPSKCKHVLRNVYGLPCAHELDEYVCANKPIPINTIDFFWRKLDMEPMVKDDVDEDIDRRFLEVVDDMAKVYKSYDQSQRLLFLRRIRELANPVMTNLVEPSPQIHTLGSPETTKKDSDVSTKSHPNLVEYQQSTIESCSIDDKIVYDLSETLPSQMFEKKGHPKKQAPLLRRCTRFASSRSFIPLMPTEFRPYIVESKNVKGDGHCGFRVVAALMGFGEDSWARVRQDLMNELTHHILLYEGVFGENDRVGEILDSLNCFTESAPLGNWFQLPYMGYLVASTYNVAFITLSTQISLTFLPLSSAVPKHPRSICMGMVNDNHFIQVLFGGGRPMPPIANSWVSHHHKIADGWRHAYETSQIS